MVDRMQPEQDDEMVAGFNFAVDGAVKASQSLVERDRALVGCPDRDTAKAVIDRACQLPAHLAMMVSQDGHSEMGGPAQVGPGLRSRGDGERDQRRVEADAGERARRESGEPSVDLSGDRDNASGEDAERLAQLDWIEVLVGVHAHMAALGFLAVGRR